MENLLREYMDRAFSDRGLDKSSTPGPVVTISREFGCPSKLIARHLTFELNRLDSIYKPGKWRCISKEIVEAIARNLELNPADVKHLLSSGGKGLIEDVLASFSPAYVSNHRIRKTISQVITSIAEQGYVIIVGRGGVGVLQDHPATIHVRLQAPREWRIGQICKSGDLSRQDASKLTDEMDAKRTSLIEMMTGGKIHPCLFDVTFNCQTLRMEEIVQSTIRLMETRKMF